MELVCPECLGTLIPKDAATVRCRTHGGEYKILFNRLRRPAPPPPFLAAEPVAPAFSAPSEYPAAAPAGTANVCQRHPGTPATFICRTCGKPVCGTCAFREPGGTARCPDCAASGMTASLNASAWGAMAEPPPMLANRKCSRHPNSAAIQQCKLCGAYMCATCDFALPGDVHICPTCAAKPRGELSPRRKKLVYFAMALAAWSTLGMAALFGGVFAHMARRKEDQEALGMVLIVFVLAPAIAGLGMAVSARDRRLANPMSITIAIIWNAILAASFLLLSLVGIMMK